MNYVQGMMIAAHAVLCRTLRQQSYCRKPEQLAAASQEAFPPTYRWTPETDAIYLGWLLELWAVDHDARWYQVADDAAQRALSNARDDRGIYSENWDGTYASDDRVLTSAGTLMLLRRLRFRRHRPLVEQLLRAKEQSHTVMVWVDRLGWSGG